MARVFAQSPMARVDAKRRPSSSQSLADAARNRHPNPCTARIAKPGAQVTRKEEIYLVTSPACRIGRLPILPTCQQRERVLLFQSLFGLGSLDSGGVLQSQHVSIRLSTSTER